LDPNEILEELTVFLRNSNIFTIAQRGVTTAAATGTLTNEATITIARSDVKNIRSVSVASVSKYFGTDYLVNYDSSGNCVITFGSNQNGAYSVSHDYGTDKIYPDYPRTDLKLDSYPRLSVDLLDITTDIGGFGNVNLNTLSISCTVYDISIFNIRNYIKAVRSAFVANQTGFFYLKGVVKPVMLSPILISPNERFFDKLFQQTIDFKNTLNYYERN
jgi:hypothetical protein